MTHKPLLTTLFSALLLASCSSDPTAATVTKEIAPASFGESSKVTLDFFTDYQCPSCIAFDQAIGDRVWDEVIAKNLAKVTFYHFPLEQLHRNARRDALASLCAHEQGAFRAFKKGMYSWEDRQKGAITRDSDRVNIAKEISGINVDQFTQCLAEGWYLAQVDNEKKIGSDRNVSGTPSVFLNGQQVNLGGDANNLIKAIEVMNQQP